MTRHFFKSQIKGNAAQALIEMAFILFMLVVLVFGIIDFGRAIITRQIIVNLSREAANLASRGTSLTNTLSAAMVSGRPLDMNAKGYVILSMIARDAENNAVITNQLAGGGAAASSKLNPASLTNGLPAANQTLVAAEIFYQFSPITPVGKLLGIGLPSQLYDVAYF